MKNPLALSRDDAANLKSLARRYGIELVILFGSRARGEARPAGLSQSRSPVIASGLCEAISERLGDCFVAKNAPRNDTTRLGESPAWYLTRVGDCAILLFA